MIGNEISSDLRSDSGGNSEIAGYAEKSESTAEGPIGQNSCARSYEEYSCM